MSDTICIPSTAKWELPDGVSVDPAEKLLAETIAWTTYQALVGYSVAICPIEVRPCRQDCTGSSVWQAAPVGGGPLSPHLSGGAWVNCTCGGDTCYCGGAASVTLPGYVGRIDSVTIDGTALSKDAYVVLNGVHLVRVDGDAWPTCQDLSIPLGTAGSWSVRYFRGDAPTTIDDWAVGVLAAEFLKAMQGDKKCRLPAGVTNVIRNGVTMELRNSLFLDGTTGLREVDAVIAQRNPHQLTMPSRVKSPDSGRGRIATWSR